VTSIAIARGRAQNGEQQPLERGEWRALQIRAAFGFDEFPALKF
jgi:hypothetical protein